ncbi:MAG: leucine-rich repeat domain-containing protein, partial [Paludibacteraceae bacterium]|nr:leucine-rich repeat domain-containing protein [Paludibacteraceae bacterium]
MRKVLFLLLLSAVGVCAQETALYNDLHFALDPIHKTAAVSSNPFVTGEILIPETIVVGQDTYVVNEIGDKAFKGAKKLTAVIIPSCIERVYRSAFDGTGIMADKELWEEGALIIDSVLIATNKSIKPHYVIPENVRLMACGAFENNKTVTRVEIPESITKIDHFMFYGCRNLDKVTIPASVTWIGQDVLTGSGIYNNDKKWRKGGLMVDGCLIAVQKDCSAKYDFKSKTPARLIAAGAFYGNKTISRLVIPEGISEIADATFYQCENLQEVVIPQSVTKVGKLAFAECGKLKKATLPKTVTEIGARCFYNCVNLQEQTLNEHIKGIPTACFFACRGLKHIALPGQLEIISSG